MNRKTFEKTQGHTVHNILQVQNYGSDIKTHFKILSPVQVTVESCTGLTPDDTYTVLMLSPSGSFYRAQKLDEWFRATNARSQHRHDYFELLLVLQGEVIQQIEGQDYLYRAGTCCLINRNIMHAERFIGSAEICFIGLSLDFTKSLLNDQAFLLFEQEHSLRENPVLKFMQANLADEITKEYQDLFPSHGNTSSAEELTELVDALLNIMIKPTSGATYRIKGVLCELLDYLQNEFYATPVRLSSSADNLLFLRIRRLLEDTDGRLPRAELAATLHYNGSYLNEIVQRHTGMCLFDYGMTFCFAKAEHLLLESDLSVSEIAVQLKFSNRTHFYTLFREKYGMTPQEWRKRQKQTASIELSKT